MKLTRQIVYDGCIRDALLTSSNVMPKSTETKLYGSPKTSSLKIESYMDMSVDMI